MLGAIRFSCQSLRKFKISNTFTRIQCFHNDFGNNNQITEQKSVPGAIKEKYTIYKDEDSVEIFDFEENGNQDLLTLPETHLITHDENGLNLKRGVTGVYDIEDLVDVLERENAVNVFVCPVPKEMNYVDFMCIVTGRSYRHMLAIAEYVRKIYKRKCAANDILPKIEGENCENWMAMDLGNIALHIFSEEAREKYDLETLWTLGPEFDKEKHKYQDDYMELLKKHTRYLDKFDVQNSIEKSKS